MKAESIDVDLYGHAPLPVKLVHELEQYCAALFGRSGYAQPSPPCGSGVFGTAVGLGPGIIFHLTSKRCACC